MGGAFGTVGAGPAALLALGALLVLVLGALLALPVHGTLLVLGALARVCATPQAVSTPHKLTQLPNPLTA